MMATPRREPVDRWARLALMLAAALLVALAAAAAFGAAPASRREERSSRPERSAEGMRLLRVLSQRWPEAKVLPARRVPDVRLLSTPDVRPTCCCFGPCEGGG